MVFRRLGDALESCIRTCRQTKPTVKLVKTHLDALRDGVQLLKMDDAELTTDASRAVRDAHATVSYQAAQLRELGVEATNVEAEANSVAAQLQSERPWRDISALEQDLQEIRAAYVAETPEATPVAGAGG